jgi:uncharacterized protein (TIGR02996 family)
LTSLTERTAVIQKYIDDIHRYPQAMLLAISLAPEENGPRLVLADWLQEQQDPRGEFIQIQCLLAQPKLSVQERGRLLIRERYLLDTYQAIWMEAYGLSTIDVRFQRGFIDQVRISARLLTEKYHSLSRLRPPPSLWLQKEGTVTPDSEFRELQGCPSPANLPPQLYLDVQKLTDSDLEQLGCWSAFWHFQEVVFSKIPIGYGGLRILLNSCPTTCAWRKLQLWETGLTAEAITILKHSPLPRVLKRLDIANNAVHNDGLGILCSCSFPALEELDVAGNGLDSSGLSRLLDSHSFPNLRRLHIGRNTIDSALAKRLHSSEIQQRFDCIRW